MSIGLSLFEEIRQTYLQFILFDVGQWHKGCAYVRTW